MYVKWYEPPPPAAVTGGFLYNHRLREALTAQGLRIETVHLDPAEFASLYSHNELKQDAGWVAADSLYLSHLGPDNLKRRSLFWLLHSTPSQLKGAPPEPREDEILAGAAGIITSGWLLTERFAGLEPHLCLPGIEAGWPTQPDRRGPKDELQLVTVANFTPAKGYTEMLGILKKLLAAGAGNWRWHIAGDTLPGAENYYGAFQAELARRPELAERIRLYPGLSRKDLGRLVAGSDLMFALSRTESFGMAVAEAVHCGLPVTVWDVDFISRITGSGALLFTLDDEAAVYEQLAHFCREPAAINAFKKNRPPSILAPWSERTRPLLDYIAGKLDTESV